MIELPFRSPAQFEPLCFSESSSEGHWFVFCGDKLLVELGPPERPRQRADLVRDAFHEAAIAEEHIGMVIDQLDAGTIELRGRTEGKLDHPLSIICRFRWNLP